MTSILRTALPTVLAAALGLAASAALAQNKIVIGYQLPLSGDNSQYGTLFKNSANLALEDFNKAGKLKGGTVEIRYEDSKSDAKEGVNIAKKFADDPAVVGVLGDFNSTVSMAAGQVYAQQKVPQLSQTASHPDFLKISDWQFRNITTMEIESPFIAKWLAENGLKKYAVVAIQNDWGLSANADHQHRVLQPRQPRFPLDHHQTEPRQARCDRDVHVLRRRRVLPAAAHAAGREDAHLRRFVDVRTQAHRAGRPERQRREVPDHLRREQPGPEGQGLRRRVQEALQRRTQHVRRAGLRCDQHHAGRHRRGRPQPHAPEGA
jgi:hypothetical protein